MHSAVKLTIKKKRITWRPFSRPTSELLCMIQLITHNAHCRSSVVFVYLLISFLIIGGFKCDHVVNLPSALPETLDQF